MSQVHKKTYTKKVCYYFYISEKNGIYFLNWASKDPVNRTHPQQTHQNLDNSKIFIKQYHKKGCMQTIKLTNYKSIMTLQE